MQNRARTFTSFTTEAELIEALTPPKDDPNGCGSLISIEPFVPGVDRDVKNFIQSLETKNLPFHIVTSTLVGFCAKGKMRIEMCKAFLDCIAYPRKFSDVAEEALQAPQSQHDTQTPNEIGFVQNPTGATSENEEGV